MYFRSVQSENIYFFDQPDYVTRPTKRAKKQINPQVLNKKLSNKYQLTGDDLFNDDNDEIETRSIASRLAQLQARYSVASARSVTTATGQNAIQVPTSATIKPSSASNKNLNIFPNTNVQANNMQISIINPIHHRAAVTLGPSAYTDTRLQAVKFLTDDMIKNLEEYLSMYFSTETKPVLPAQVIYDWHADWSDLTEMTSYKDFPVWQTKYGSVPQRAGSSMQRKSQMSNEDPTLQNNTNNQGSINKKQAKQSKSNTNEDSNSESESTHLHKDSKKTSTGTFKLSRPTSKLSAINETNKVNQALNKHVSINKTISVSPHGSQASGMGALTGQFNKSARNDSIHSRVALNTSAASGCLVNYQLSQPLFKEKGWTVVNVSVEEQQIEYQRKIIAYLQNCLKNIEYIKQYDERNGLTKSCKLKFYGDNKREQIEKYYKATNIRPKKSLFAMSILRNELPKPLDLNYIIECVSNPNLSLNQNFLTSPSTNKSNKFSSLSNNKMIMLMDTKILSLENLNEYNNSVNSLLPVPRPPLLSTQTKDGTTSVYYPNGGLAILISNTVGFNMDSINTQTNTSLSMASNTNFTNPAAMVSFQNVHNSYSTLIYDYVHKRVSKMSYKSKNSDGGQCKNATNYELSQYSFDKVKCDQSEVSTSKKQSDANKKIEKQNNAHSKNEARNLNTNNNFKEKDTHLLAVITPSGNCVCYRKNGMPRFVCTETGGCLINNKGLTYFQWKWDDGETKFNEKFKKELNINLNEFIRIEYSNPSNIKLAFNCDKENLAFELSRIKENQNKINEFLSRTVSDVPMRSKAGQIKLTSNTKPSTVLFTAPTTSNRPTNRSNLLSANAATRTANIEQPIENQRIEKLLEQTISYKDIPVMKDLLMIQKRIRTLLEDWLLHCRTSLGIMQPDMYILPDLPQRHKTTRLNEHHSDYNKIVFHRRKSKSVENLTTISSPPFIFPSSIVNKMKSLLNGTAGISKNDKLMTSRRSKSAFITTLIEELVNSGYITFDDDQQNRNVHSLNQPDFFYKIKNLKDRIEKRSLFDNIKHNKNKLGTISDRNEWKTDFSTTNSTARLTPRLLARANTNIAFPGMDKTTISLNDFSEYFSTRLNGNKASMNGRLLANEDLNLLCPVSLHSRIAFERLDLECRCRKQNVPFLHDIEFDSLIKMLPTNQLAIVAVVDSRIPATDIQLIMQDMYSSANKSRLQSCKESLRDEYRYFFYDIQTATLDSNNIKPMLLKRHNVSSGMVLIYKNSKLLFCDHIFNGYGYSQQDFKKQLNKSKEDAVLGKFLPYNFKFKQPTGTRGYRTAWGGEIGGLDFDQKNFVASLNLNDLQTSTNLEDVDSMRSPSQLNMRNNIGLSKIIPINASKDVLNNEIHLPKINKLQQV